VRQAGSAKGHLPRTPSAATPRDAQRAIGRTRSAPTGPPAGGGGGPPPLPREGVGAGAEPSASATEEKRTSQAAKRTSKAAEQTAEEHIASCRLRLMEEDLLRLLSAATGSALPDDDVRQAGSPKKRGHLPRTPSAATPRDAQRAIGRTRSSATEEKSTSQAGMSECVRGCVGVCVCVGINALCQCQKCRTTGGGLNVCVCVRTTRASGTFDRAASW
jgi:hypothetical protein